MIIIMITFIDLLFILVFIFSMFCLQVPNVKGDNYILNKLIIFVFLFCFYFVLQIIKKIKNNCKINLDDTTKNSLIVALSGSLGYSLFTDLTIQKYSKDYMGTITEGSKYILYLVITIGIIMFIAIIKIIEFLIISNKEEC